MQTLPALPVDPKVPLTTRVRTSTRSAVERFAFDLSTPQHRVSDAAATEMLIEAAFSALGAGKIPASCFPLAVVGPLKELELTHKLKLPEHFRAAGQPPTEETDEERVKREAEEAEQNGPGPVGRPQRGKGIVVGEGPKGGPKKAGRR